MGRYVQIGPSLDEIKIIEPTDEEDMAIVQTEFNGMAIMFYFPPELLDKFQPAYICKTFQGAITLSSKTHQIEYAMMMCLRTDRSNSNIEVVRLK